MDSRSNEIVASSKAIEVSALSTALFEQLDFTEMLDTTAKKRNTYLQFSFVVDGEVVSEGTVLFVKPKHFGFVDPAMETTMKEEEDRFVITVDSKAFARFVELDFSELDGIFSNNYFDISAGDTKSIYLKKNDLTRSASLEELQSQLIVRSVFDL
jgi:beta-mannosidase